MGKNCGTHVWFLKLTYMFHRIPACAVFYIKKCKLQKKTNFRRKLTFLKYSFKTKIRIQFDGTNGNWTHYVTEISWFHTFLLSEFPWFKNICLLLFLPGRLHLEASVCQTNRDRLRYSPSVSACTYKQKFVFFFNAFGAKRVTNAHFACISSNDVIKVVACRPPSLGR